VPDSFAIFIRPPTEEELLRRLRDRKRESDEQINKRFNAAKQEMDLADKCGVYDVFLVNDTIDHSIRLAVDVVAAERKLRRERRALPS
jgi:guanylate kinase